jgi:HlyD family secretion protein
VAEGLFRPGVADRLTEPDELDRPMRIAGPGGWALTGTLALVIVAVTIWGFAGSIPTHVPATGILGWSGGGVRQVVARAEGQLVEVQVQPGELVTADQPLARLTAPDAQLRVADADRKLETLRADRTRMREYYDDLMAKEQRSFEDIRENTRSLIAGGTQQIAANQKIVKALESLLARHYTTSVEVEGARERLFQIQAQQDQNRQKLIDLQIQQLAQLRERTESLQTWDLQIVEAEGARAQAQLELDLGQTLRSPIAGRVVEVLQQPGMFVGANTPVVLVEYGTPTLEATLFLPAGIGKEAAPGMAANVSPDTVERAEYGTLAGTVERVSPYPATPDEVKAILADESLVQATLAHGPVLVAAVALQPDATSPSNYRWSSGRGPDVRLNAGTLATATVTVRAQPPVTLVIPAIRRFLGIYP